MEWYLGATQFALTTTHNYWIVFNAMKTYQQHFVTFKSLDKSSCYFVLALLNFEFDKHNRLNVTVTHTKHRMFLHNGSLCDLSHTQPIIRVSVWPKSFSCHYTGPRVA